MNGALPVHGQIWVAHGSAPKGVVLMPPQSYGGDSLESLIFPMLRCGINVIRFIPVGFWDRTQPGYTTYSAVDDLHALIAWTRSVDYDRQSQLGK